MRRINQRILILCEGMSEYLYAKALQQELPRALQHSIAVEIDYTHQNDPLSLAKEALRRSNKAKKERNPYNSVWLFFDHDNSPQLQAALQLVEKHKLQIAYTSICFEHWLILHYENCGRAFQNAHEAIHYLRKFWPGYHKTRSKSFEVLRDRMELAVERANLFIRNQDADQALHLRNPHFTIPELIHFFGRLREEGI